MILAGLKGWKTDLCEMNMKINESMKIIEQKGALELGCYGHNLSQHTKIDASCLTEVVCVCVDSSHE